jgi:anti-sigma B factor antagonist
MIEIEAYNDNEIHFIAVKGDVDASSSIHLDEAMTKAHEEEQATKIVVDCTELAYISSAGLGVFMSYIDDFKAKGIKMVLFGLSEKVFNVFQILGLDQLLTIVETKEQATEKVNEL